MGSIEKAGKLGTFSAISLLIATLVKADPAFTKLTKFFTLFTTFMSAGGADKALEVAEALYSEENIAILQALGEEAGETNTGLSDLTIALVELREESGVTTEHIHEAGAALRLFLRPWEAFTEINKAATKQIEKWNEVTEDVNVTWGELGGSFDRANSKLRTFIDLLNSIKIPGGDGNGDDDDDDGWEWPKWPY